MKYFFTFPQPPPIANPVAVVQFCRNCDVEWTQQTDRKQCPICHGRNLGAYADPVAVAPQSTFGMILDL